MLVSANRTIAHLVAAHPIAGAELADPGLDLVLQRLKPTSARSAVQVITTQVATRLGEFELLIAEVGDELESAAEGGDEPAQYILGGDIAALDLGNPGNRYTHPDSDLLLSHSAPLAHFRQPPAAGVIQHRGDRRIEGVLAPGSLNGTL
jgi:hypothetical protein